MIDAPALKMLDAGVNEIEHSDQIDIDRVDECLGRQARGERGDPGVGHHNVEPSQLRDARVDRGGQRGAVADVGHSDVRPATFFFDEARGFLEVVEPCQRILIRLDVGAEIETNDVRALRGEQSSM